MILTNIQKELILVYIAHMPEAKYPGSIPHLLT